MAKIEFRYRDYKDPQLRGTWLLVNGKQVQRISYKHLSRKELADFRKKYILGEKGYLQTKANQFRQQTSEDHIKEVNLGDLNDEIVDITKDPQSGKWEKEDKQSRDYTDPEEPEELEKKV